MYIKLLPAIGTGNNVAPDFNYALSIKPGMRIKQNNGTAAVFRTIDSVDFGFSSSLILPKLPYMKLILLQIATNILFIKKTSTCSFRRYKNYIHIHLSPTAYDKVLYYLIQYYRNYFSN
jgi:hypothetical protein